jgi:FKBP-type peptidyl-prolyl cis-trans isomerase
MISTSLSDNRTSPKADREVQHKIREIAQARMKVAGEAEEEGHRVLDKAAGEGRQGPNRDSSTRRSPGAGEQRKATDTVKVNYRGAHRRHRVRQLYKRNQPATFTLSGVINAGPRACSS